MEESRQFPRYFLTTSAHTQKSAPGHRDLIKSARENCYESYVSLRDSPRWQRILNVDARHQRLLWASTGTKDAAASDTLYVTELASPFTVNSMPEKTLNALAEHGDFEHTLPTHARYYEDVLSKFTSAGIDIDALALQLQDEGAKSFIKSWNELLKAIEAKGKTLKSSLS